MRHPFARSRHAQDPVRRTWRAGGERFQEGQPVVNSIIRHFALGLLVATLAALGTAAPSPAREVVRLAVQQTGTVAWELAVINAHRLDEEAGLTLDVVKLASPEAGKIALRGG